MPRRDGCFVSTTVHGALSFGNGKLDEHGFFEYGCPECAREHERLHPEDGACWPHTEEQIAKLYGMRINYPACAVCGKECYPTQIESEGKNYCSTECLEGKGK